MSGNQNRRVTEGVIRFGPFEADLSAGQLQKNGTKIKIQEMPLRVLACLLERPGEVVTREELRDKLWAKDEFVEFEHSLNTAVNKLRSALGDHADQPRYIETIPRRGYRFVGAVEGYPGRAASPRDEGESGRSLKMALWIAAGIATAAAASGLTYWLTRPTAPALATKLVQLTRDPGLTFQPALSPDGKFVAYASDRASDGNLDIWVQSVEGGQSRRLTSHEADDYEPDFSPDGEKIAFRSERGSGGVYVVPFVGGEERPIAEGGRRPRYSPDGGKIAYFMEKGWEGPIHTVPAAGGAPTRVAEGWVGASPVWSPDGSQLLFPGRKIDERGPTDWCVASLETGRVIRTGAAHRLEAAGLGIGRTRSWSKGWSADQWLSSNEIVFPARFGDSTNLWKLRLRAGGLEADGEPNRLTSGSGIETDASITSGGRLTYSSLVSETHTWAYALDPESGKVSGRPEQLTEDTSFQRFSSLSADGTILAFTRQRGDQSDIWIMDLNTGEKWAIADTTASEWSPIVSPDGSKVAYSISRPGNPRRREVHVVGVEGGIPRKIGEGDPRGWSPDGQLLLSQPPPPPTPLSLIEVATGQRKDLIQHPEVSIYDPRFSPDGEWIAFHCPMDADGEFTIEFRRLFIVPSHGDLSAKEEDWISVTDGTGFDGFCRWSPGGDLLYFVSDRDGYRCIYAQPLDATTKEPAGPPFGVAHFHRYRRSMTYGWTNDLKLGVATDKLTFPLVDLKGNIWMMEHE